MAIHIRITRDLVINDTDALLAAWRLEEDAENADKEPSTPWDFVHIAVDGGRLEFEELAFRFAWHCMSNGIEDIQISDRPFPAPETTKEMETDNS